MNYISQLLAICSSDATHLYSTVISSTHNILWTSSWWKTTVNKWTVAFQFFNSCPCFIIPDTQCLVCGCCKHGTVKCNKAYHYARKDWHRVLQQLFHAKNDNVKYHLTISWFKGLRRVVFNWMSKAILLQHNYFGIGFGFTCTTVWNWLRSLIEYSICFNWFDFGFMTLCSKPPILK